MYVYIQRVLRDSKCTEAEMEDDEEDTYQPLGHGQ